MMDYALETTFDVKFTSRNTSGVPTTLSGTPSVEIYEDNSTTQITSAETLTVDFDSVTGLNNLRIAATAANGFESGKSYSAVISAGTVGGTSVVGEVICNFSINRANIASISNDSVAADNAEAFFDGTGYAGTNNVIPTVTSVTNGVSLANGAITNASLAGNMETVFETNFGTAWNATRNAWVTNVQDTVGSGNLPADMLAISTDATAANNLEAMFDGSGYTDDEAPAKQSQVSNLSVGAGGISTIAESFTKSGAEPETNTYTATAQDDGVYHIVEPDTGTTDIYYQFDIGGNGVPQSFTWNGYAQLNGDLYAVYAYNFGGAAWEQIGTINAANGTSEQTLEFTTTVAHVGTGANLGKVRIRFYSTGATTGTAIATDRLICTYATVSQSVGYALGSIWVDTNASNTNTEVYVDGVADNPVSTWAAALSLSSSLGIKRFRIAANSSITLSANSDSYEIVGDGLFSLNLNSQSIANAYIRRASISGVSSGANAIFEDCSLGNSSGTAAAYFARCGFACASGTPFNAQASGEYFFVDCISQVAGSGTPYFDFSGLGASSGVNFRRWGGGTNITLDSNNTLSLEVLGGGGQTIATGGASCEIRGIARQVSVVLTGGETVQIACVTGPISISGVGTSSTVTIQGVSGSITNTASGSPTITDRSVSQDTVNAEVDTALADYDGPTRAELTTDINSVLTVLGSPVDLGGGSTLGDNLADMAGATFTSATDSLEAIRDRGDAAWTTGAGGSDRLLMVDTTIATLSSQTQFTLTAGSADDDAYVNCTIVIEDASTSTQKAVGLVSAYVGATKTVTLKYDPGIFTMAPTDKVYILAEASLKASAKNRQLDVSANGNAGIDWANVDNAASLVSLSQTTVSTVTTNTDMRGTNNALLAASAPANFGDLAITASTGRVTVGTNNDKTGYSLSASGLTGISAWTVNITGNLSGSVGSVTGNVGGNVVGSVASVSGSVGGNVVGSVGSVVGNVGGNVVGSVASVAGNVGGNVVGSVGSISGVSFPTNFGDLAITVTTGRVTVGTNADKTGYSVDTVNDKTGYSISGVKNTLDDLNDVSVADIWTTTLTEGYAADGSAFNGQEALFMLWSKLAEMNNLGLNQDCYKLDGSTLAMRFLLDHATLPTKITRVL